MLTELFTSKVRIKLLVKLFLNPDVSCYIRELSSEFAVSPNSIKGELDSLSNAGYLTREKNGRSAFFQANRNHPLFQEISSIVRKTVGIDNLIEQVLKDLGDVQELYILDDYAEGSDSGLIDVLVVGDLDIRHLERLRKRSEEKIKRKIRIITMGPNEFVESRHVFLKRPNWKIV